MVWLASHGGDQGSTCVSREGTLQCHPALEGCGYFRLGLGQGMRETEERDRLRLPGFEGTKQGGRVGAGPGEEELDWGCSRRVWGREVSAPHTPYYTDDSSFLMRVWPLHCQHRHHPGAR